MSTRYDNDSSAWWDLLDQEHRRMTEELSRDPEYILWLEYLERQAVAERDNHVLSLPLDTHRN